MTCYDDPEPLPLLLDCQGGMSSTKNASSTTFKVLVIIHPITLAMSNIHTSRKRLRVILVIEVMLNFLQLAAAVVGWSLLACTSSKACGFAREAECMNIYIYIFIYLFIYLFIHLFIYLYLFFYLSIYLFIYLYIYIYHMHVHRYMIYTHTQININRRGCIFRGCTG